MKAVDIDVADQTLDNYANVITVANGNEENIVVEPVRGSWKSYYQNIADVLNHGVELIVTPRQILEVMRVFDAAMESSETGEIVCLS